MIACIKFLNPVQPPGNTGSASRKCLGTHLQNMNLQSLVEIQPFPAYTLNECSLVISCKDNVPEFLSWILTPQSRTVVQKHDLLVKALLPTEFFPLL